MILRERRIEKREREREIEKERERDRERERVACPSPLPKEITRERYISNMYACIASVSDSL